MSSTLESAEPKARHAGPRFAQSGFTPLGIAPEIVESLAARGITEPFPIQTLTIPDALAGRDVCGKARTGSGKTLAFGIPLIQRTTTARKRRPTALILVPTRELANQVTDELGPLAEARELWIMPIYGGASMVRQVKGLHAGVDIVVATPGRLNDLLERKELSLADVRTVVIDEADQMADMGFLPQVRSILEHIDADRQTLLFSATLDGTIGALVRDYQVDPVRYEAPTETLTVETLEQRFIGVERPEKLRVAARICGSARRSIVFVRTKHGADRLALQLTREGVPAAALHGGLMQSRRERTLASFASGRAPVLVATNVAARGIHVDDVDIVLHFDLPEDGKTYLHRSGRTARAGAGGLVVTLVSSDESREVRALQREAGINLATTPMGHQDPRLDDLSAWDPPAAPPPPPPSTANQGNNRYATPRRPRSGYRGERPGSDRPARPGGNSRRRWAGSGRN